MKRVRPMLPRIMHIDRKIREGTFPNARTLAEEYEVSERTIHHDIDHMRNMLDCPIGYDTKKRGYYYTEPRFALPSLTMSEQELFALCVAEKALDHYRATPLYEKLRSIYDKLVSCLPEEVTVNCSWLNPDITFLEKSHTSIIPGVWETVAEALNRKKVIIMKHRKAGAVEATTREVLPLHIVSYDGEWYLIGHCRLRQQTLTFGMSRIENAEISENDVLPSREFDLDHYLGESFGITIGKEEFTVEIEFTPDAAPYIRERTWHRNQTVTDLPGGGALLAFPANSLREVARWVLGWGPQARVRKPDTLISQMRGDIEAMAALYSD